MLEDQHDATTSGIMSVMICFYEHVMVLTKAGGQRAKSSKFWKPCGGACRLHIMNTLPLLTLCSLTFHSGPDMLPPP